MIALRAFVCLCAAATTLAGFAKADDGRPKPARIVSLNVCTDQLLLKLADPDRIAAVSHLSLSPPDAPPDIRALASRHLIVRGLAEEVIPLKPDLVVAGVYGARPTVDLLKRLGYRVVEFAPESNFDDVRATIRSFGAAIGESERAAAMIADMDRRLAAIAPKADDHGRERVYARISANNWVAGNDTLAAAISAAAGYQTLGGRMGFSGYRNVSLEALVTIRPDLMSLSSPWSDPPSMATEMLRHPALRAVAGRSRIIDIPDNLWTCGGPYAVEAAERLAAAQ
ncbi:ABC transporter substrate-binding protein [bacterium]|nr:ABC transporter substrate-binding protein [bacterium]